MRARRICWGPRRSSKFNVPWRIVRHDSVVVVTASEGSEGVDATSGSLALNTQSPQRHTGAARFTVSTIAPRDGGVTFHVTIDWRTPLTLWTDIILLDELEPRPETAFP